MKKITLQYDESQGAICDKSGMPVYWCPEPESFEVEAESGGSNKIDSAALLNLANGFTADEIIKLKDAGIV